MNSSSSFTPIDVGVLLSTIAELKSVVEAQRLFLIRKDSPTKSVNSITTQTNFKITETVSTQTENIKPQSCDKCKLLNFHLLEANKKIKILDTHLSNSRKIAEAQKILLTNLMEDKLRLYKMLQHKTSVDYERKRRHTFDKKLRPYKSNDSYKSQLNNSVHMDTHADTSFETDYSSSDSHDNNTPSRKISHMSPSHETCNHKSYETEGINEDGDEYDDWNPTAYSEDEKEMESFGLYDVDEYDNNQHDQYANTPENSNSMDRYDDFDGRVHSIDDYNDIYHDDINGVKSLPVNTHPYNNDLNSGYDHDNNDNNDYTLDNDYYDSKNENEIIENSLCRSSISNRSHVVEKESMNRHLSSHKLNSLDSDFYNYDDDDDHENDNEYRDHTYDSVYDINNDDNNRYDDGDDDDNNDNNYVDDDVHDVNERNTHTDGDIAEDTHSDVQSDTSTVWEDEDLQDRENNNNDDNYYPTNYGEDIDNTYENSDDSLNGGHIHSEEDDYVPTHDITVHNLSHYTVLDNDNDDYHTVRSRQSSHRSQSRYGRKDEVDRRSKSDVYNEDNDEYNDDEDSNYETYNTNTMIEPSHHSSKNPNTARVRSSQRLKNMKGVIRNSIQIEMCEPLDISLLSTQSIPPPPHYIGTTDSDIIIGGVCNIHVSGDNDSNVIENTKEDSFQLIQDFYDMNLLDTLL